VIRSAHRFTRDPAPLETGARMFTFRAAGQYAPTNPSRRCRLAALTQQ